MVEIEILEGIKAVKIVMDAEDSVKREGADRREEYKEGYHENKLRGMTFVGHRNSLLPINDNMYSILNCTALRSISCWVNSLYKPNDIATECLK